MENDLKQNSDVQGGALTVIDLVRMFEESEDASLDARKQAERDRDYVDNIQLSTEEKAALKKRGQPEYMDNRIKSKIDFLVGLEKQQRINPHALPRTPVHEDDADGANQALIYVADKENFDFKRSAVWRNLLVEGSGGVAVAIDFDKQGKPEIKLRRIPWDRMFWDPHSSESDFSDAGYLGAVQWKDFDDAILQYPDGREALETTLNDSEVSDTYDDKPKYNVWGDKKRKRVRIVQIWIKRGDDWHFAEYTKGGILKAGPSPYVDDQGNSEPEFLFQSAYVTRDNDRYGLVREMISLQDAINKRNSKALHQLNTAQIVMRQGAVSDIERARKEAARPDGVIEVNSMGGPLTESFTFNTRSDLAQAQYLMLQEAKNSIDLKGPNATSMGDKAQGSTPASGRAITASQQGGMIALGDLLDNLRHLDLRVFRAIWSRVRQYWTEERWLRVTDDEKNIKWVGLNVDKQQLQAGLAQDPSAGERIAGAVGNIAELDIDIIIEDAPDSLTPALEQWQALTDLAKAGIPIPPEVLISSAPNLKNKKALLDKMSQPNEGAQMQQQLVVADAQAKIHEKEASANLKEAQAAKTAIEAQLAPEEFRLEASEKEDSRVERLIVKDAEFNRADRGALQSNQQF